MPSINNYTPLICIHCGSFATFISINHKIPRCQKSTSSCPEIKKKQQHSRDIRWESEEEKVAHMKAMSMIGNASKKRQTQEYKDRVGSKISKKMKESGRMSGVNNINYGGKITSNPDIRIKMRKPKSDSSKMGKWYRTQETRDKISANISMRRQKFSRTWIELAMMKFLEERGISFESEFMIANKTYKKLDKLMFRHVYDIYVPSLNLLIECDGEYWHGSLDAWKSDTRNSYVANSIGYRILRISESYIKNIEINADELLRVMTSDTTFAVLGDFYDTIPTREFCRNRSEQII